ncbi:hypothetical protein F4780DRAFT_780661 [Xylariomycetidae sp. FL0641]|nr:hypothetical protein F4780DRAFT_780661 [Xylariomycetidae sp. FL0641]
MGDPDDAYGLYALQQDHLSDQNTSMNNQVTPDAGTVPTMYPPPPTVQEPHQSPAYLSPYYGTHHLPPNYNGMHSALQWHYRTLAQPSQYTPSPDWNGFYQPVQAPTQPFQQQPQHYQMSSVYSPYTSSGYNPVAYAYHGHPLPAPIVPQVPNLGQQVLPTATAPGENISTTTSRAPNKRKRTKDDLENDPKPTRWSNTFMIYRKLMKDEALATTNPFEGNGTAGNNTNWAKKNGALSKNIAASYRALNKDGDVFKRCEALAAESKRRYDEELAQWEQRNPARVAKARKKT